MARVRIVALTQLELLVVVVAGCCVAAPRHAPTAQGVNAALCRCTLLIPVTHNDGTPVSSDTLAEIEAKLYERFGGYTVAATTEGAYRMADGTRAHDRCLEVWVVVPESRVDELRHEAGAIARLLRQETMYFEVAGAVEFVPAAKSDRALILPRHR